MDLWVTRSRKAMGVILAPDYLEQDYPYFRVSKKKQHCIHVVVTVILQLMFFGNLDDPVVDLGLLLCVSFCPVPKA